VHLRGMGVWPLLTKLDIQVRGAGFGLAVSWGNAMARL